MTPDSLRFRVARRFVPELKLARTYDEQLGAYERARPMGILLHIALALLFGLLSLPFLLPNVLSTRWTISTTFIVVMPLYYLAALPSVVRASRKLVRQYLQLRGVPICTKCGYCLEGVESETRKTTRCPECGDSIDPASEDGIAQVATKKSSLMFRIARRLFPDFGLARTNFERGLLLAGREFNRFLRLLSTLVAVSLILPLQYLIIWRTGAANLMGFNPWLVVLLVAIALAILGVATWMAYLSARQVARRTLAERGIPICDSCGADLTLAVQRSERQCLTCGKSSRPVGQSAT